MVKSFDPENGYSARFKAVADTKIQPWQRLLKKGDFFFFLSHTENVLMWAEVLEDQADPKTRGYCFCRCFSTATPHAIEGYVHIAVAIEKVSEAIFRKAQAEGWPHDKASFGRFAEKLHQDREVN